MHFIPARVRAALARLRAPRTPPIAAAVTCLWDAGATLGENPRWDAASGSVFWVDIPEGRLHRYRLADGERSAWSLAPEVGAIAVAADGRVAVTIGAALYWFDPAEATLSPWCTVADLDVARCRFNDGGWAPDGSLWLASMDRAGREPLGRLHRVDPDGRASVLADGYTIANGPAFDPARGVAYVADSPARTVYALPLDTPRARRPFARLGPTEGFPDGMAVEGDGHLLVAHHDGGCLTRWAPDGRRVGRVALPFARACAVALVPGAGAAPTLVVTSGRDAAGRGGGLHAVTLA